MFNMDARQMEKMMKQMGIAQETIEAVEVIIKMKDKELVISSPQVTKIKMSGQTSFQIVGEVSEKSKKSFTQEDIDVIVEQTGATEDEAADALEETGDIAEAILKLKK